MNLKLAYLVPYKDYEDFISKLKESGVKYRKDELITTYDSTYDNPTPGYGKRIVLKFKREEDRILARLLLKDFQRG